MKIIVKQEADTTCAWIVGEDGETQQDAGTVYLKSGQQVEIEVEIAAVGTEDGQMNIPKATIGEVGEITGGAETRAEPEGDQNVGQSPPDEESNEDDQPGGANDKSVLR